MPNRLDQVRSRFERRIDEAEELVRRGSTARHSSYERVCFTTRQRWWLFEIAFLKTVVASEQFFEHTLGLFVLGERTPSRYKAVRLQTVTTTLPQLLEVFRGDQEFVGWNEPTVIIKRSQRWLRNGEPFRTPLEAAAVLLTYVRRLRNAIAHDSTSANEQLGRSIRALYGSLPSIVNPGRQLQSPAPTGIPYLTGSTLLESIANSYRALASQIVPR